MHTASDKSLEFRMNNEVKESLEQMSALYKVNESDFIKKVSSNDNETLQIEKKISETHTYRNIYPITM